MEETNTNETNWALIKEVLSNNKKVNDMNTNDSNIYKLAVFCHNEFKETILKNLGEELESCFMPMYCAINNDNTVLCSKTPHILNDTDIGACLIIQQFGSRRKNYNKSWYIETFIQFIDKDGCVHGGYPDGGRNKNVLLENGFSIRYEPGCDYPNEISLWFAGDKLCQLGSTSWDTLPKKVLELYCLLKKASSLEEMKLVVELYKNDETFLQMKKEISDLGFAHQLLKKERDQLQETINEIRKLIKS